MLVLAPGSWGTVATALLHDHTKDGAVDMISIVPTPHKEGKGAGAGKTKKDTEKESEKEKEKVKEHGVTIYRKAVMVDMSRDGRFDTLVFDSTGDGVVDRSVALGEVPRTNETASPLAPTSV